MAGNGNNQWTKRAKANSPQEQRRIQSWRTRYQADAIMAKLARSAGIGGQTEQALTANQIKALEIMLDRLEPRLSAVEQTLVDADQAKPESELIQEAIDLLKGHPELLRQAGYVPIAPQDTSKPLNTGTND